MYVSKHHRFSDFEAVISVMESHPLGALVVYAKEGLVANGNPPEKQKDREVEFSMKEVLREEVEIYGLELDLTRFHGQFELLH